MTKHYAYDEAGFCHRRTSKTKTYAYTVVAQPCFKHELDEAQLLRKSDGEHWDALTSIVTRGAGVPRFPHNSYISHVLITEEDVTRARDELNMRGREEYVRHCAQVRIAAVQLAEQQGRYRSWVNQGWCGRFDLAMKLQASTATNRRYHRVCVLEAKIVEKKS